MVFPEKSALAMADLLEGKQGSLELSDMGTSALKEACGNILANAFLNAFAAELDLKIIDSIPHIVTDMLNSVMSNVLAQFACKTENALVFKNNFSVQDHKIEGHAFIFFDPDSFNTIIKKIKNYK